MNPHLDLAATHGLQQRFAHHLRDPVRHAAPAALEDRRLAVYRDLVFNNIDHALGTAFPVLHRLVEPGDWQRLVRDFFSRHKARTPLFHQLAQEFLDYLDSPEPALPPDMPFFRELAHYEWVELALSVAEDDLTTLMAAADADGDLLAGRPLRSPLAWHLRYQYPVHRIGPGHQPRQPPLHATDLVVTRNRLDQVKFTEINVVTARLLALIEQQPQDTGATLLRQIAHELGAEPSSAEAAALLAAGRQMLDDLRARDVLLGARRT